MAKRIEIHVGDRVQMKKPHPCGSDQWELTRVGADVKLRCCGCAHVVMMDRVVFEKRVKRLLERAEGREGE